MRTLGNDTAVDLDRHALTRQPKSLEHLLNGRSGSEGMGLTVNRNLQHPARQRAAGASLTRSSFETVHKGGIATRRVAQERSGEKPIAPSPGALKPRWIGPRAKRGDYSSAVAAVPVSTSIPSFSR